MPRVREQGTLTAVNSSSAVWVEMASSPASLVVRLISQTGITTTNPATSPSADIAICRRAALVETNCTNGIDEVGVASAQPTPPYVRVHTCMCAACSPPLSPP